MKTAKEIKKYLKELKSDSRLKQPCATVLENAPLALVQLNLESRIAVLEWVLDAK